MSCIQKIKVAISASVLAITCGFSLPTLAEAVEQTVRIEVTKPADGGQCQVQAVFKGDHDNCSNDAAKGRADCSKDTGCVCTRQEKHVTWQINDKQSFSIAFDQGSANPFVTKGDSECNFKSNKKGKLRCRVKGKDVPRGDYKYSISVPECPSIQSHIKIY
ncbi:MAG: hypothetical protein H6985_17490 [Pseudomonadales bacterium]|nr:hypothetical protein [Halioglobus sp.]MCP5131361.1 hypothetical protein [Pseudomonadales bacterium]